MKHGSTLFLKLAIVIFGLLVLTLCVFLIPAVDREWAGEYPTVAYMKFPVLIGIIVTALPFFFALFQGLKLLGYVDHGKAFSEQSVSALRNIKYAGAFIGLVYAAGMPLIYYIGDIEDAPGLIVLGMIFTVAPLIVAAFAAVLQRLVQHAVSIKSENDLTV